MKYQKNITIVLLCLSLLANLAIATANDAKAIEKYVNEKTLAVLKIDIERFDTKAIADKALAVLKRFAPEAHYEEISAQIQDGQKLIAKQISNLKNAGAQSFYVLANTEDLEMMCILYAPGADGPKIIKVMEQLTDILDMGRVQMRQDGDIVLLAVKRIMDNYLSADFKASPRPQLFQAFAAVQGAPIQFAFIPSDDILRVMDSTINMFAVNKVNLSSERPFSQNYKWNAVAITLPPNMSFQSIIKTSSPDAAKTFNVDAKAIVKLAEMQIAQLPDLEKNIASQIIKTLVFKQQGDLLVMTLSAEKIDSLINEIIGPIIKKEFNLAVDKRCMTNLKQVAISMFVWSADHQDKWPTSFEILISEVQLGSEILNCPLTKEKYVYRASDFGKAQADSRMILAYDRIPHEDGSRCVAFADGHVEKVKKGHFAECIARDNEKRKELNLPQKALE
ncbi:MAG: hypothetical protein JEZ07_10020 [Phycisphaerae bacterium]|nr:hypothetical protein [Phycisphaerae bacterium]